MRGSVKSWKGDRIMGSDNIESREVADIIAEISCGVPRPGQALEGICAFHPPQARAQIYMIRRVENHGIRLAEVDTKIVALNNMLAERLNAIEKEIIAVPVHVQSAVTSEVARAIEVKVKEITDAGGGKWGGPFWISVLGMLLRASPASLIGLGVLAWAVFWAKANGIITW